MPRQPTKSQPGDKGSPGHARESALADHAHPREDPGGGGGPHTHDHATELTNVTADEHHAQSHTHASHTGIGADDHHAQSHSHASHSGIGVDDHHARDHSIIGTTHTSFPMDATKFLNGSGAFAVPPGGAGPNFENIVNLPWVDPRAHGVVGDGVTDDTAALQAMATAVPATGQAWIWPYGFYPKITGLVTFTRQCAILGPGIMTYNEGAGSLRGAGFLLSGATAGLKWDNGVATSQNGPTIWGVNFVDTTGAKVATAIEIRLFCHWTVVLCGFRGMDTNLKINSDNTTYGGLQGNTDASWGWISQCTHRDMNLGIWVPFSGSFLLTGGDHSPAAGGTSIRIDGGGQHRIIGAKFDAGLNSIQTQGRGTKVIGCTFEQETGTCVILDGNAFSDDGLGHTVEACHFNPLAGATAISVTAAASDAELMSNTYGATNHTHVTDNGFLTRRIDADGYFPPRRTIIPTTSATTLVRRDEEVIFDLSGASGNGLNCKLPTVAAAAPNQIRAGKRIMVKNLTQSKLLNVTGASGETLEGQSSFALDGAAEFECDGAAWVLRWINRVSDGPYAPGSFTLPDGTYKVMAKALRIGANDRVNLLGDSRLALV